MAPRGLRLGVATIVLLAGCAVWRGSAAMPSSLGALSLAGAVTIAGSLLLLASRRQHAIRQAAEAAECEFRLLAEHASDMILRVRAGGERVYVSPACHALLGYTPREMLRRRSSDDLHPADLAAFAEKWAAPLAEGESITCVYRMRRRDGGMVWVEATSKFLPPIAGEPPERLVVVRDISQRQQAASRLEQANRLLKRAESMTHISHWRYEPESQAVFWSDEVYRIVGWPLDRTPTLQTAIGAYHPEDQAEVASLLRRTIETGTPFRYELRIVRPDGEIRFVTTHGEPEYAEDDPHRMVALVGTFQDVTEARALEAQVRHSQKLEAIGKLAAGVAHDFNNILQGVLGGLELIIDEVPRGSLLGDCALAASRSAQRGATLTSQLLSFARKQMLLPDNLAVAPLLEDLRALLARTLGPHIQIEAAVAAGLPAIFVDADHLRTALVNLASNAADAMAGGGVLRIEGGLDPATQSVVIAVSDTGPGMSPATLARAMEPFFTTKGPACSGLGLPMVQGFARQSGGDLRLSSVPGQGTRAEILLPVPRGTEPPPAALPATPEPAARRVLLVDDVADVLYTARLFLERAGLQVVCVESGDEALALMAAGERFQALVTDYAMPGVNGTDLVDLAREMQPGLPALIITGFAEVDIKRAGHAAEVLRKPFRAQELVAAVAALVEPATPAVVEESG